MTATARAPAVDALLDKVKALEAQVAAERARADEVLASGIVLVQRIDRLTADKKTLATRLAAAQTFSPVAAFAYEVRASWWSKYVPRGWCRRRLAGAYFRWKTRRKYGRYRAALESEGADAPA